MKTVDLPGGSWGVFGIILLSEFHHPLEVLLLGRRWRSGEVCSRYPCLLEEPLEPRRDDEQQRLGRPGRRVPPSVQEAAYKRRGVLRGSVILACLLFCRIAYNPESATKLFSRSGKGAPVWSERP